MNSSAPWTADREFCLFIYLWLVLYFGSLCSLGNSSVGGEQFGVDCVSRKWLVLRGASTPPPLQNDDKQWLSLARAAEDSAGSGLICICFSDGDAN